MQTILVIEDEPGLNRAITAKLESRGYRVVSVATANEAIGKLESGQEPIDFIWLDLLLPGMSGLEFLKWLRSQSGFKDKKVAVVSASAGMESQAAAKKLGVVDYLIKSDYSLKDVVDRIDFDVNKSHNLASAPSAP